MGGSLRRGTHTGTHTHTQERILATQTEKSHRKIAMNTVAASGLATIPLQKSQGFPLRQPQKYRQPLAILGVSLKIAISSQRPCPQVAAAVRFRGRSDHGTLRKIHANVAPTL